MPISESFTEAIASAAEKCAGPLVVPWPLPGQPAGFMSFGSFSDWLRFVNDLALPEGVPDIVRLKYERSQKVLLLTWIDFDLIKAAELISLTALELALTDRYALQTKKTYGVSNLAHLLRYLPEHDGLTEDKIGMNRRCGSHAIIDFLTGARKPSLATVRNDGAHGEPFDGFPISGLIELVRDLIAYAYRDVIQVRN